MKRINRIISVILIALIISNFSVAMAAEGDEQVISLQFAQDGTITDVYNNTLTKYGLFTPEVITSMTGDKVITNSTGAIKFEGENIQDILNSDELTFELWVSINSDETSTERRLFAIRDIQEDSSSSIAEVVYSYTTSSNTAVLKNRLGSKCPYTDDMDEEDVWIEHSTDDIYQHADTWRHYSFTRKWDSVNSKWITKTYINGVMVNSSNDSGTKSSAEGYDLYLGSNTNRVTGLSKGLLCSYGAFNVYKKELDSSRIAELYNSSKNDYKVPSNHMNVETVTPAEGDISYDAGKITVKFSNFIDPTTVNGNIVFSKADGTDVQGWSVSVRDDIFADITIPELKHREKYKVSIKSDLKSQNEINATEKEIIFTAVMPGYIIDEDFQGENFVVGESSPAISGIKFVSVHENYKTTNIKVGKTESGTKYLRLSPAELNKSESISIIFSDFSKGYAVVEYKIRIGGDDSIEPRMGMLNSVNGTYLYTLTNPLKIGGNVVDTDDDGFAFFKVIIRKNSAGYFQYDLYYTTGGEEKMYEVKFDNKMITSVSLFNIIQYYQTKGTVSSENYLDLAYIGYYTLDEPSVVESSLTTFNTETDENVTVTFGDKMNEDSISADTVKLINNETGSVIPWKFISYNALTKTASFKIDKSYLEYETEYAIDCFGTETEKGVKNSVSTRTTFDTPSLDITLSSNSFSKSESGVNFSTTVYSTKAAEVKFIAVLYDLDSRAVQVKEQPVTFTATGRNNVSILMNYPSIEEGFKLKVIALENDNGNLKPIKKKPLEYLVR